MASAHSLQPRFRRLVAIVALALLFVGGVALVIDRVLLASYESLEAESIRQSTEQVVKALQAEVRQIAVVGNDYASWDDMYAFVRDRNAKFAELNFSKLGLREMEVDVVYVVDEAGREVYSAEQRAEGDFHAVPATDAVRQALRANMAALAGLPEERDDRILLRMPGGVAVVDASPIIQTDRTGPARGTLVFVRMLNAATLERMSSVSQLPVSLWQVDRAPATPLPPAVLSWAGSASGPARFAVPLSDTDIGGYARLSALDGTPAIVLGTRTPRSVYQQGRETAQYLLGAIVFLVILVIVITAVLDEKLERSTPPGAGQRNAVPGGGGAGRGGHPVVRSRDAAGPAVESRGGAPDGMLQRRTAAAQHRGDRRSALAAAALGRVVGRRRGRPFALRDRAAARRRQPARCRAVGEPGAARGTAAGLAADPRRLAAQARRGPPAGPPAASRAPGEP